MSHDVTTRQNAVADDQEALRQRRRKARRTALILGVVSFAVFVTFLMTGIIGRV